MLLDGLQFKFTELKEVLDHRGKFFLGKNTCLVYSALEKAMASHSSVLAWRIPGMGEPGGLRLWGRTELDTTEAT